MATGVDTLAAKAAPIGQDAVMPVYIPRKALFRRFRLMSRLLAFKVLVRIALGVFRFFRIPPFGTLKATYQKSYPVGARLSNDVWIPSSYKPGQKLPLYIDIHGGGFAIGDPGTDSSFCSFLAEQHGICVVSVNYRKAPFHPFPQPTEDLVEIVQAVLEDPDLPVDKSKGVAMGGFSAGGNLTLSVCLRDELQGKIKGILPWYPVTDFSNKFKGEMRRSKDGEEDVLKNTTEMFSYAYVNTGQDRTNPFLSPIYADRTRLPKHMFFITCEYDVLCQEAEVTAKRYAEADGAKVVGDENGWVAGTIRYMRLLDVQHGFNLRPKRGLQAERVRMKAVDESYAASAEWLKTQVYS